MNIEVGKVYLWQPASAFEVSVPVEVVGVRRSGFKLSNGWVVNEFGVAEGTKMSPGGKIVGKESA